MYIGLPQWQHPAWHRHGLQDLADYARYFNCVEGNTTFYTLPSPDTVLRWRDMTHDDFRFCFKFPATISHQAALRDCEQQLSHFYHCVAPLSHRIGQLWLQLPATFSPAQLPNLWRFLDMLPRDYAYGVEVRHPDFFAKGNAERVLNQGLQQRAINRVMLDSRPVHAAAPTTPVMREAQRKKPRLPVHAVKTGQQPLVRFIGNEDIEDNLRWFAPWITKLQTWQADRPYLFIHTPDIGTVLSLAQALWPLLTPAIIACPKRPDWPQQASLF